MKENLKVLARGMKDLHGGFIRHQIIQRLQRNPTGQWVHQNSRFIARARHRELHKTQLGVIGPLSQKLRVNSHIGVGCGLVAKLRKLFGGGECSH